MKSTKSGLLATRFPLTIILATSFTAMAQPDEPRPNRPPAKSNQVKVMISCQRIGATSDAVRAMRLTNDTNSTLGKGKRVYWSTSDGEKGSMLITENLPKGQSLTVYDNMGNLQYTCEAWFFRSKLSPTK